MALVRTEFRKPQSHMNRAVVQAGQGWQDVARDKSMARFEDRAKALFHGQLHFGSKDPFK
jgi:hypothetical protein